MIELKKKTKSSQRLSHKSNLRTETRYNRIEKIPIDSARELQVEFRESVSSCDLIEIIRIGSAREL